MPSPGANQVDLEGHLGLTSDLEFHIGNFLLIVLGFFLFATNPEQAAAKK